METDEQIARRVQEGAHEAYGELIVRYQDKLLRYARKFLLGTDDAQDVVQEVFIKAYQNIQSFDTGRRFSPWIYRIAHNEFVNAIKKHSARRLAFDIDLDTILPNIVAPEESDSAAQERDLKEALDVHLQALDPKYREPLVLYYVEGMDYREISDILQIPVSTVGVRLARAKAALRKMEGIQRIYE